MPSCKDLDEKIDMVSILIVFSVIALPVAGEHDGHTLRLALLPDHHLVKVPTAASTAAIMADAHSLYLADGHSLDDKLIVLKDDERQNWLCISQTTFIIDFQRLLSVKDELTLPLSNLLTLFLLIIMSRFPVSPRSPIILRKTVASVPLPLTSPVQMVARYFITKKREHIFCKAALRANMDVFRNN